MSGPEETWRPQPDRRRARRHPRRTAVRAGLGSLAAGPLVGLLWWATALGGLRERGDDYLDLLQSVGEADAGFALYCLLAGVAGGLWWVLSREHEHDVRAVMRLVGLLVGGLLGAVVAWVTGWLLARAFPVSVPGLADDVVDALAGPSPSAAVVAGVLLWPLAVGALVAVDTLREMVWQALSRER